MLGKPSEKYMRGLTCVVCSYKTCDPVSIVMNQPRKHQRTIVSPVFQCLIQEGIDRARNVIKLAVCPLQTVRAGQEVRRGLGLHHHTFDST